MGTVNHFRNKILSSQRNVPVIQILGRIPPKKGYFTGDFLFVRRKRHARVRSVFFRSSHGVGRLITYTVLVVRSGQTGFALKIALKC